MSALIIKSRETDEEVHRIDTTGKSADQIARIEQGMSINFDWENYYWDEVE
jgi:hypothetical protein